MRLHHNLVNCRRALIDSNQLKKPGDEAGGAKFFKNTLRRLSVRKMEKYRAEALANEQVEDHSNLLRKTMNAGHCCLSIISKH